MTEIPVTSSYLTPVTLTNIRVSNKRMFTGEMLQRANIEFTQIELGRMVAELSTYVRTHHLPPEQVEQTVNVPFTVPATWWDHWKRDVATKHWWLRWICKLSSIALAIRTREVTLTVDLRRYHVYPDAPAIGRPVDAYTVVARHHAVDYHTTITEA